MKTPTLTTANASGTDGASTTTICELAAGQSFVIEVMS